MGNCSSTVCSSQAARWSSTSLPTSPTATAYEWSTTTTRTEGPGSRPTTVTYHFTVQAAAPVQTASGTYPAFKILRQDNDTADGITKEATIWFSPYVGMVQRQLLEFQLDLKGSNLK